MYERANKAVFFSEVGIGVFRFHHLAQNFPPHFHEYYVIGLVEHGNRTLICGQESQMIGPGDLLLLNPGDPHGCFAAHGGQLDYLGLRIDSAAMRRYTQIASTTPDLPRLSPPVLRDAELCEHFVQLTDGIFVTATVDEPRMTEFVGSLLQACTCDRAGKSEKSRTADVCAYIKANIDAPLSLDALSQLGGMSKSSLLRLFSQETGLTPHAYLANVRVEYARRLLEQGLTPAEVAIRTGFFDQSHFTNRFRSLLGFTPGYHREVFSHAAQE